jgi:sulfur-carrier protein
MKLVYFAWIRERIGLADEEIDPPEHVRTVQDLLTWLKSRGEEYAAALEHDRLVQVAVDRIHANDRGQRIGAANEIALFPPMTGG